MARRRLSDQDPEYERMMSESYGFSSRAARALARPKRTDQCWCAESSRACPECQQEERDAVERFAEDVVAGRRAA